MTLTDYSTGTAIRPATLTEWAMGVGKPSGAFRLDGIECTVFVDGDPDDIQARVDAALESDHDLSVEDAFRIIAKQILN